MTELPSGTVTFAFTDIEDSRRLLQELGDEEYARVSGDHRRLVRQAFGARGGTEIDTEDDACFFSFPRASDAVAAAVEAQRALSGHRWPDGRAIRVRIGLRTDEPHAGEVDGLGSNVARARRVSAAGHGGRILISGTTRALLGNRLPEGVDVRDLGQQPNGEQREHEHVYELTQTEEAAPKPATRLPLGGLRGRFGWMLMAAIMLLAIALLVRFAFF